MVRRRSAAILAALFIWGTLATPPSVSADSTGAESARTKSTTAAQSFNSLTARFAYNTTVGTALSDDGKTRQIELRPGEDAQEALSSWGLAPGVVAVVPNLIAQPLIEPADPYLPLQWDMQAPVAGREGASNVTPVWSSANAAGVVVAVIDTGRTNHPDLVANMPEGWGVDMITSPEISRDGDGRDTNPLDEGDWVNRPASDLVYRPSTWHGTHVAGTIGAAHNDIGVRGIAPSVSIMHVRVLGRGGGNFYDVIDGIRWAAGLTTSWEALPWSAYGLPDNMHPADVINLSLGANGACWDALQQAISLARAAGTVVVTAAGNDFRVAANFTPANCNDTVTVAAVGQAGGLAYYSNFGSAVDIAAPGGDMSRDTGILSTIATGATTLTGYGYTSYQGTSMAAPHVAGVAALVASAHPTWGPADIELALYAGVRPFPADALRPCVTNAETPVGAQRQCGVGLLDAVGALSMVQPTLTITAPEQLTVGGSATVSATSDLPGEVTLSVASASAAVCVLVGTTVRAQATGTCTLNAVTAATADHVSAAAQHDITVIGMPQTINFGIGPLLTETLIPFGTTPPELNATASSGLAVNYESRTPAICEAVAHVGLSAGWDLRLLSVGTCSLLATQGGNSVYDRAPSVERSFTIVQGSQTIPLDALQNRRFDPTIEQGLPQFSSAGLPLQYAGLTSSVCEPRFNGSMFTLAIYSPGTCTIRADQSGSSTYRAAPSVTRSFEVYKLPQAPLILDVGGILQSVGSSTGYGTGGGSTTAPFTVISTTPTICTVSGRIVRYLAVGTCVLEGTKGGDALHYHATATLRITVFAPAKLTKAASAVQIGRIVYGNGGTWSSGVGPTPSFKYQWFSCTTVRRTTCNVVPGATSTNLTVTSALVGRYAFLRVAMYQVGYERASAESNPIKVLWR